VFDNIKEKAAQKRDAAEHKLQRGREVVALRQVEDTAAYRAVFRRATNTTVWEYCRIVHETDPRLSLSLHTAAEQGRVLSFNLLESGKTAEASLLIAIKDLGLAGWEICATTHSSVTAGTREKNVFEKGVHDLGKSATVATGLRSSTTLLFKRQSHISNQIETSTALTSDIHSPNG
jgi:hypothetical protein